MPAVLALILIQHLADVRRIESALGRLPSVVNIKKILQRCFLPACVIVSERRSPFGGAGGISKCNELSFSDFDPVLLDLFKERRVKKNDCKDCLIVILSQDLKSFHKEYRLRLYVTN